MKWKEVSMKKRKKGKEVYEWDDNGWCITPLGLVESSEMNDEESPFEVYSTQDKTQNIKALTNSFKQSFLTISIQCVNTWGKTLYLKERVSRRTRDKGKGVMWPNNTWRWPRMLNLKGHHNKQIKTSLIEGMDKGQNIWSSSY